MKCGNRNGKKTVYLKGSYTIEMGIIMPLLMFILVSIIYLVFYLYDVSLMQQTVCLAGMRGGYSDNSSDEYIRDAREYGQEMQKSLWASESGQFQVTAQGNQVTIQCGGRVASPFGGRYFRNMWSYQIEQRTEQKRPVQIIRNCRKAEGMLEG